MENRVLKLEWRTDYHEKEIEAMKGMQIDMKKELSEFKGILSSIRFILIGAVGAMMASQVGLFEFLKTIFF